MVAFFENVWSNRPIMRRLSWDALAATLVDFRPNGGSADDDKKAAPCWSPVSYPPGATRRALHVDEVYALVLDYDGERTIDEAVAAWDGYARVVHTSWSHSPTRHKIRVVLPLAEPIAGGVWRGIYRAIVESDGGTADSSCIDPSRLYLLPCMGRHWEPWAFRFEGDRISLLDHAADVARATELVAAAEAQQRKEAANRARRAVGDARSSARAVREVLQSDPGARERLGARLGGSVVLRGIGPVVVGVMCPACGRPSLWWIISPSSFGGAACNHRKSCGWAGPLWRVGECGT